MGQLSRIAAVFQMSDEMWRRHAHPWSVYTRFTAIPPSVLAIWSRSWIGWWSLALLISVVVWLWFNPRVFPPVDEPVKWASKGIFGERIWATANDRVPPYHRTALRLIAILGLGGIAVLTWGVYALDLWPTLVGATLVVIVGEIYKLTGPRPLTFAEATATIAEAAGRDITYTSIPPEEFAADLAADGVPQDIDFLVYLFGTVLDGRNAIVADGVEQVLERPARDFADYARATADTGVWTPTDQVNSGSLR
jgi:hypothetical protein